MSDAARYAYLDTRVSILAEQLLLSHPWDELVDISVDHLASLLRAAGLAPLAEQPSTDPRVLEQMLITALLNEAALIVRPLSSMPRELITYWMRRYELINLKALLRGKLSATSPEEIYEELVDLSPFESVPIGPLLHSEDAGELLRQLESTQYAEMARLARRIYEEQRELFGIEAALDRQYFAGLLKRVNGLEAGEQRQLRPLIGTLMDQVNLVWLLRYRFDYGLSPPHTYFLLVPTGHHLNSRRLLELVRADSFDQVRDGLPRTLAAILEGAKSIAAVERLLAQEVQRTARYVLRHTIFNLARAFAYLLMRENQLMWFHIVIKGRELQLDPDTIKGAVGLVDQDTGAPPSAST